MAARVPWCALLAGVCLVVGVPGALARERVTGVPIRTAETVASAAQRITGDARNMHASWFQIVNPTTARKWVEQGGRVLAETQPVVNWSLLAAPTVPPDSVQQLQAALLAMNTHAPAVMSGLGIKEWARAERKDYLALLDYTKE